MATEDTGHSSYFLPIRKQGYIFFVIFSYLKDKELVLLQQLAVRFYSKMVPMALQFAQVGLHSRKNEEQQFLYHFQKGKLNTMSMKNAISNEAAVWNKITPCEQKIILDNNLAIN